MKKVYMLFAALAFVSLTSSGQTIWNLGNDEAHFPIKSGFTGEDPDYVEVVEGLGIHAGKSSVTNMGQVENNEKTFTSPSSEVEYSFINRFKFNGAGYSGANAADLEPTTMIPAQRYLTIDVTGKSIIYAIGVTGSSGSSRKLFVTDGNDLIGTMDFPASSDLNEATVEYTGEATTLYLYCNAAINLYYLSVTEDTPVSVKPVLENANVVGVDYYNISGANMGASLDFLPSGVYIEVTKFDNGVVDTKKVVKN